MKYMSTVSLVVFLFTISGCSVFEKQKFDIRRQFSDKNIIPIQLHRGGGSKLPENTIETFIQAWAMRVIPEADIRESSDGVIVCVHDNTLQRLAPSADKLLQKQKIEKLTLAQLQSVDVGEFRGKPGQKIPTLENVFMVMGNDKSRYLFLDYKSSKMSRLAAMIKKYDVEKQVIFTTTYYELIRKWKQIMPASPTMIWLEGGQVKEREKLETLRNKNFEGISIIQLHYQYPVIENGQLKKGLTDEFVKSSIDEFDSRGILLQVLPYEENKKEAFKKLIGLGVTSFATDYPDETMEAWHEYHKWRFAFKTGPDLG